eukprot:scaffold112064_cov23-Cyclotella_meneghiniana.AAC.1
MWGARHGLSCPWLPDNRPIFKEVTPNVLSWGHVAGRIYNLRNVFALSDRPLQKSRLSVRIITTCIHREQMDGS